MLYVHDQWISLKKLNCLASLDSGLLSSANTKIRGKSPIIRNKIIPGTKKLLNGELPKFDKGILSSSPVGEMIIAPNARNVNIKISTFRVAFVFINISSIIVFASLCLCSDLISRWLDLKVRNKN